MQCEECQFIFSRVVPSDNELCNYYLNHYDRQQKQSHHPKRSRTRLLKYWCFSKYIQVLLRKQPVIRTLEVGCNEGLFLDIVQNNPKFQASGIDLCEQPIEYARKNGNDVTLSDLESMNYPDNSFDFVFAIHVMEHVQNPERMILEMQRMLKPGGYMFAVMPCGSHYKARMAGKNWHYLSPPSHLWYFGPKTLSMFVNRLGFKAKSASCFYHRAHVRILAQKDGNVDTASLPRWLGSHPIMDEAEESV